MLPYKKKYLKYKQKYLNLKGGAAAAESSMTQEDISREVTDALKHVLLGKKTRAALSKKSDEVTKAAYAVRKAEIERSAVEKAHLAAEKAHLAAEEAHLAAEEAEKAKTAADIAKEEAEKECIILKTDKACLASEVAKTKAEVAKAKAEVAKAEEEVAKAKEKVAKAELAKTEAEAILEIGKVEAAAVLALIKPFIEPTERLIELIQERIPSLTKYENIKHHLATDLLLNPIKNNNKHELCTSYEFEDQISNPEILYVAQDYYYTLNNTDRNMLGTYLVGNCVMIALYNPHRGRYLAHLVRHAFFKDIYTTAWHDENAALIYKDISRLELADTKEDEVQTILESLPEWYTDRNTICHLYGGNNEMLNRCNQLIKAGFTGTIHLYHRKYIPFRETSESEYAIDMALYSKYIEYLRNIDEEFANTFKNSCYFSPYEEQLFGYGLDHNGNFKIIIKDSYSLGEFAKVLKKSKYNTSINYLMKKAFNINREIFT
jgi:hypothetical protein